jgi:hypothetical protein
MKKNFILAEIIALILIIAGALYVAANYSSFGKKTENNSQILNNNSNAILEKKINVQYENHETKSQDPVKENSSVQVSDIKLDNLANNSEISFPLKINGQAPGGWFFEGTFPIQVLDKDLNIISSGYSTAKDNWMQEGMVRFEATLNKQGEPQSKDGVVVFKKSNPSGLKENDSEKTIYIIFSPKKSRAVGPGCALYGCNEEICANSGTNINTVCVYKPEYECYKTALCQQGYTGECGWMLTPEVDACIKQKSAK